MFVRRSLRLGESSVSTSTILARRALFDAVPFVLGEHRFDDSDWVLRAAASGAQLVYVPQRMTIWRAPIDGNSITGRRAANWRAGFAWIRDRRELVTPRAYAAFLLVRVAAMADRAGEPSAARIIWHEANRHGSPGAIDIILFAGRWIVPARLRTAIRARLATASKEDDLALDQGAG